MKPMHCSWRDITVGRAAPRHMPWWTVMALAALVLLAGLAPARAQIGSDRYSSLVMDARTGRELSAINADEPRYPASLTKMMTLYLVFEALRDRRIGRADLVPVSPHAAAQEPSKLGLLPGTRITVEQAILGLVTKSANDAAVALGEMLGADEASFAQTMTLKAHALGMARTTFRNASGLPDPDQVTTARDMALLARHLVLDFPDDYRYFATTSFRFRNRMINGHDHLLESYPGADGIKTGFITASGYNLVTSAIRSNVRLIGVVLGAAKASQRDQQMKTLLDEGFGQMDVAPVVLPSPRDGGLHPRIATPTPPALPSIPTPPVPVPPSPRHAALPAWSVQVGSFPQEAAAREAAASARRIADIGQPHVESATVKGHTTWRAQIIGLSAAEASGTCAALARHRMACVVIKPEGGQLARNP